MRLNTTAKTDRWTNYRSYAHESDSRDHWDITQNPGLMRIAFNAEEGRIDAWHGIPWQRGAH